MFKNIFGNKGSASKTGFFKVENEMLIPINETPGNGSINSCIESLGIPKNHVRMVHTFNSDKIVCLGFKTLSKQLVLVLAKNVDTKVSYLDIQKLLNQIDWDFENSSLNVADILEEGIEFENFSLEFLQSVIDLKEDGENIYKSDQLGLYFTPLLVFFRALCVGFTNKLFFMWINPLHV